MGSSDFNSSENSIFRADQPFSSNLEVITTVGGYYEALPSEHYREGIVAVEHYWVKSINIKGDYIEK